MSYRQFFDSFRRFITPAGFTRRKLFSVARWLFASLAALTVCTAFAAEQTIITLPSNVTEADIQKALDSLPADGGQVVVPAGKIEITRPIVLGRDGLALRGAGRTTILFLADNANCPVIIMGEPVNEPKPVHHLRVSGLLIDGNRDHQQRECWRLRGEGSEIRNNGITAQNVSDSTVEQVTCAHCRSGGLVTTLDTHQFTVRDLDSYDNEFDGLACFETRDCVFSHLNLHDNPGAGLSLDGGFNHNVVTNAVLDGNDLGIFMRWSHDNQFRNISIRNSHDYGVFMAENLARPRADCVNNVFTDVTADRCGNAVFRVNDVTCTNNILTGAKFDAHVHGALSLAIPGLLMLK